MNLIILEPEQFISAERAVLSERQVQHIVQVLKLSEGAPLKLASLNGNTGQGVLSQLQPRGEVAEIRLDRVPPATLPLTLLLALPRPQMIKRILQTVACMGVSSVYLLQTARVEKSFWQSPSLTDTAIREQLLLGLEQAGATQLPDVHKCTRFRPFVEDVLPGLCKDKQRFIAHPGNYPGCPSLHKQHESLLAIGPEGGFSEKEVAHFLAAGFSPFQLGERILKVETAVAVALAKLYP